MCLLALVIVALLIYIRSLATGSKAFLNRSQGATALDLAVGASFLAGWPGYRGVLFHCAFLLGWFSTFLPGFWDIALAGNLTIQPQSFIDHAVRGENFHDALSSGLRQLR